MLKKHIFFFFIFHFSLHASPWREMKFSDAIIKRINTTVFKQGLNITWIKTLKDDIDFNYVVKAEIYPEDPSTLFLTLRGGGVTLLDISSPENPTLIQHWDENKLDVEGQDRLGNLFILVARSGYLLTFKIAGKKITKLAKIKIPSLSIFFEKAFLFLIPALHTRIHQNKNGRKYALITCPQKNYLVTIDITQPEAPQYISNVDTSIKGIEGIYIHKDHAFVGGFNSNMYKVYDISDPSRMKEVLKFENGSFVQMVPDKSPNFPDILFTALWGNPGGLASFDISNPKNSKILNILLKKEFSKANRVKIMGNRIFLPLERIPGGFGVVNISNPAKMEAEMVMEAIPGIEKPYTLNIKNNFIYVFGSTTNSLAILKIN